MTIEEVKELMPGFRVIPLDDGKFLVFPEKIPTGKEWKKR